MNTAIKSRAKDPRDDSAPSAADLKALRATLTAEADRLAAAVELSRRDEWAVRQDVAGHDEMDDVITQIDTQRSLHDADEAAYRLELTTAAIRRIDADHYGRCIDCNSTIARERLLALPTAERCIGCQSKIRH